VGGTHRNEKHQQCDAVALADVQAEIQPHSGDVRVRHVGAVDHGHRVQGDQGGQQTPIDLVAAGANPSALPARFPHASHGRACLHDPLLVLQAAAGLVVGGVGSGHPHVHGYLLLD